MRGGAALQKKKNDTNYGTTDDSITISAARKRAAVIFDGIVD